jgi:Na+/proline symporter
MPYRLLADAVLLLHLGFILFVVFGALLVARRRRLLPLHLAAAGWGFFIEASGAVCPLTWVELYLRRLAGDAGYEGGFVDHYLLPLIYPAGLTRELQIWLGIAVLLMNALMYAWIWRRARAAG